MELCRVDLNLNVSFNNTEKEQFNANIMKELAEALEFNDFEIDNFKLIDQTYSSNLRENKYFELSITSNVNIMSVEFAKCIPDIINGFFEDNSHNGAITKIKFNKETI